MSSAWPGAAVALTGLLLLAGTADPEDWALAAPPEPVPVAAEDETPPVGHTRDAADDPAIWVHPSDPALSLVIGNDKRGALESYDLEGGLVQRVTQPEGFWGNVDVRQDVDIDGVSHDVVGVVRGGIRLYSVDPQTRQLVPKTDGTGAVPTFGEGFCLYDSELSASLYAFAITRAGRVRQYDIEDSDGDGLLEGRLVRDFQVGSEVEGCAADDETGVLYLSEEDVALWRYGAEPGEGVARTAVDTAVATGGNIAPDGEGVAVVDLPAGGGYVIVSAQNAATPSASYFTVYERSGSNAVVGAFRVVDGASADDCDRTDGIAAYAGNLGAPYPGGLFVCQDNNNVLPGTRGNQDFKYVPLDRVLAAVHPPDQPPAAVFDAACSALTCNFDAFGSSDPGGSIVSYQWDFGDGSAAAGGIVEHTFAAPGAYVVSLTVTDDDGATGTASRSVDVTDVPPPEPETFDQLALTFDGEQPASEVFDVLVNSGTAPVEARVLTRNGGAARRVQGRTGPAADFPDFDGTSSGPRAVLGVRDVGTLDELSPGTARFELGAEFRLDALSASGSSFDDGDNLIQRGLYNDPGQYKLQVDRRNPSCVVRGDAGRALVRSSVVVDPALWYGVRCIRDGGTVELVVTTFQPDGSSTTVSTTVVQDTGRVSFPATTSVAVGGRLSRSGSVPASADQFNGVVDDVYVRIG